MTIRIIHKIETDIILVIDTIYWDLFIGMKHHVKVDTIACAPLTEYPYLSFLLENRARLTPV